MNSIAVAPLLREGCPCPLPSPRRGLEAWGGDPITVASAPATVHALRLLPPTRAEWTVSSAYACPVPFSPAPPSGPAAATRPKPRAAVAASHPRAPCALRSGARQPAGPDCGTAAPPLPPPPRALRPAQRCAAADSVGEKRRGRPPPPPAAPAAAPPPRPPPAPTNPTIILPTGGAPPYEGRRVRRVRSRRRLQALLRVKDIDDPKPKADEVVFTVKSAALNYNDIWGMRGQPVPVPLPHVSGLGRGRRCHSSRRGRAQH